jgi:hypothetical protein
MSCASGSQGDYLRPESSHDWCLRGSSRGPKIGSYSKRVRAGSAQ